MTRVYPDRPFVGVGVVLFRGDELLLGRRAQAPRDQSWTLPGGVQELGETVFETAHRELMEETAVTAEIIGLIDVVDGIHRDGGGRVRYHYTLVEIAAEWLSGEAVAGDDLAEVAWVPIDAVADHVVWEDTVRIVEMARLLRAPADRS